MRHPARTIALYSILTALSTAVMLIGGAGAVFTYCSPLLAGMLLTADGNKRTKDMIAVWGATAFLSMLLCTDKESVVFYIFFGWYPMVKGKIDTISSEFLKLLFKILFFALLTFTMNTALYAISIIFDITDIFQETLIFRFIFSMLIVLCMLGYDYALIRISPRIKGLAEKFNLK